MSRWIILSLVLTSVVQAQAFRWQRTEHYVALQTADGAVVWQFNHPPAPMKPHFHPVGLPGHPPLTWKTPADHIWHLGLWFSWKFINGRNFWETDSAGRSEGLTRATQVAVETRADFSARVTLDLVYQPHGDAAVPDLQEHRVIEISAPAADGSYTLDWRMEFQAPARAARLGRTPLPDEPNGKPWGGYAGLIWRFAEDLQDWQVLTEQGHRDLDAHGAPARAADFSGTVGGVAMGAAILEHPTSVRQPTPWYVAMEHDTPFACLSPAPLFREELELSAGESFALRYQVVIHPARWNAGQLRQAWEAYAGER